MDVLQDRPELDAVAGHQAHRAFDRGQVTQGGELVEQVEHRLGGPGLAAGHLEQALADHQPQPAGVRFQPVGWQDQEDGGRARLEVGEAEG